MKYKAKSLLVGLILVSLLSYSQEKKNFNLKQIDSMVNSLSGTVYAKSFESKLIDGRKADSSTLHGKVTLLSFWSIGCVPCRKEIPILNKIYEDQKADTGFQLLTFTYDQRDALLDFMAQNNIRYPVGMVEETKIYEMNSHTGFPCNILIDKNGVIKFVHLGLIDYDSTKVEDFAPNIPNLGKSFTIRNIYNDIISLIKKQ